ncbi:hypothetical protein M0813_07050 [Anaeramoeba flamelloides]|uniref:Cathepsin L n=1 Tax=Anaeramoeba flamelloides TaxID=1746091 RepID=A0AAV7Z3B2_9EUKA|nr:hypothetical protein M0812_19363 [Anaeramoeba flamelloides]KAJ6230411.1 hypothetical protein M0813_07050 [Anaeramoeba flamelloides]
MKQILFFFFILFCAISCDLASNNDLATPSLPVIADTYMVKGVWRIPYETADIVEPITINRDATKQRLRLDYYNGLATDIYYLNENKFYQVEIELDKQVCLYNSNYKSNNLINYFPNITLFEYAGTSYVKGKKCNNFQYSRTETGKTLVYNYYVLHSDNLTPVQYALQGYNSIGGSHIDHYYMDYLEYTPNKYDSSAFDVPKICGKKNAIEQDSESSHGFHILDMQYIFPQGSRAISENDFHHFKSKHSKEYENDSEEEQRFDNFHKNSEFIRETNKKNLGYKLSINHFADLNTDEIHNMLTRKNSHQNRQEKNMFPHLQREFKPSMNSQDLPTSFNWIDYGAVSVVKDQVVCGSCWSFSSTGAIESANYLKTGKMLLFSEQNLMDCSWAYNNNACNGGWQDGAFVYAHDYGLATTESYGKYLGKAGYCNFNKDLDYAKVKYYLNITSGDTDAVKMALYQMGPLAVSTDVSEAFMFYSSGVLDDKNCHNGWPDLVHAVLLVGWGVEDNNEYWLVKNSWSTWWGDEGYIKIQTKGNVCGIATWALYPVLEKGVVA